MKTSSLVFSVLLAACSSSAGPGEPPVGTGGTGGTNLPDAAPPAAGTGGSTPTGGSAPDASVVPADASSPAPDASAPPDVAAPVTADPATGVFPIPAGMTAIFDGATLNGWDGDPARWSVNVADKAIQGKTGGGNLIKTKMDYGDFRLILTERMVLPGPSTNHLGECIWGGAYQPGSFGFSGCIVFIAPHGSLWDYGGGNGVFTGKGAGEKTDWQQIEILANAATGQILAAVNGVPTTDYTRKQKGKPSPIGLQSHADHAGDTPGFVEYKDIYVESPPKSMELLTVKH